MKAKLLTMSLLAASLLGVTAQSQEKKEISLAELSKISLLREYYVRQLGVPYKMATERAKLVIEEQQRQQEVSTRSNSRNATPAPGSIWIDRDATGANYSDYHNYTPEEFIKKIFVKDADKMGSAIDEVIQNVTFTGVGWDGTTWTADERSLHYFDHGDVTSTVQGLTATTGIIGDTIVPRFGIEKGFILATGPAIGTSAISDAEGFNKNTGGLNGGIETTDWTPGGLTPDADLKSTIAPTRLCTQTLLEFDFKPYVDSITFKYVFASTEFKNYSNSAYNDAFGFFVTGNNLEDEWGNTGSTINIARYPNGQPIAVNNSNWGLRGDNNYSGYDMLGSSPVTLGAAASDSRNPQYHLPVYQSGRTSRGGIVSYQDCDTSLMEYDGHSIVLTAKVKLNKGEWYHMKLAIGNASDPSLGSGAYLMAGSFDLGFSSMSSVSPYMTNSMFGLLGAGAGDASALGVSLSGHVIDYFANDPDNIGITLDDTAKYAGHLYEGCPRTAEMEFTGVNENLIFYTLDDKWDKYMKIDSFFVEGEKIEKCVKFGTGAEADFSDYEFGDTILYDFSNKKAEIYYSLNSFPTEKNGSNGNISFGALTYKSILGSGTGDTLYFFGYSHVSTDVKYSPVTETSSGSLSLGLFGGSKYLRWRSVDGIDCDPEENSECRWRFLRDTVTGKELAYSKWELLGLYDGYNAVPIVIQEPSSCRIDTIWIGGSGPVTLQRYIDIPYAAGVSTVPNVGKHFAEAHKDFAFYAKFNGEPITVQATGYYSHDTITLAGIYQEDGLYEGSYKYVIKQVTEPWNILFASGTTSAGEETSNSIISTSGVWANGNTLYINTNENAIVNIYTLTGSLFKQITTDGNDAIQLPRGFYIISINGVQYKIMIK